jgi:muramoyltetrapeptide carboxypeptidase LdcA involved in peptidoglycan recycling
VIAGSRYGDVATFADTWAPDGTIVYVEAAEHGAIDVARDLWSLRLAGWFDRANAVLVGRTQAPDAEGFRQEDAVRSALADLDVPVVLDVDCGHVVPQLALVNGAAAHLVVDGDRQRLTQHLR